MQEGCDSLSNKGGIILESLSLEMVEFVKTPFHLITSYSKLVGVRIPKYPFQSSP